MNYNYAKTIKQLREKMIISQTELADLLEVAFSTVDAEKLQSIHSLVHLKHINYNNHIIRFIGRSFI